MNSPRLSETELIVIAVNKGRFPRRLFKYRAIDRNTKKCLKEAKFWFAKPSTFNDPLDCNLSFNPQQNITKYKLFLKKIGMAFALRAFSKMLNSGYSHKSFIVLLFFLPVKDFHPQTQLGTSNQ